MGVCVHGRSGRQSLPTADVAARSAWDRDQRERECTRCRRAVLGHRGTRRERANREGHQPLCARTVSMRGPHVQGIAHPHRAAPAGAEKSGRMGGAQRALHPCRWSVPEQAWASQKRTHCHREPTRALLLTPAAGVPGQRRRQDLPHPTSAPSCAHLLPSESLSSPPRFFDESPPRRSELESWARRAQVGVPTAR